QINVAPLGGTPNYAYSWNNNAGNSLSANVNPTDTTQYIVNVTDSAGCIGQDTVYVNVPSPIADSTLTFHLCDPVVPNGLIQIFASNGVLPYQYSITNGQSYQSSPIFLNLPFGYYPILIKDAMNCIHSDSATISTLSQKPRPDFIVNTNMMQADTFVVVDISNPRPDSVIWTFPSTVTVLDNNPFAPIIVSADTGAVDITMETHFGACIMYLTKTIQFIKADTIAPSPNGNGIEELTLFPNPNTGQFSIEVKLYKKQTFAIYVYNSQGIEQTRVVIPESNYSLNAINIPNPIPGTYVLKVIAEYDSKSKTIVVTQ
ncbi:MAG: T9SS type A sorting domain-containing protein, partial [Bacteroidota bacterium]|nr:T9SS type A sorting domain-containing protein [Bacteroidota bacterium]